MNIAARAMRKPSPATQRLAGNPMAAPRNPAASGPGVPIPTETTSRLALDCLSRWLGVTPWRKLLRWLGPGATLLEPAAWREQMRQDLQQMLAAYMPSDGGINGS
jgi:hypothetical protein